MARHFVERAFEDTKGTRGMADYQVRGFNAWHQNLALLEVALNWKHTLMIEASACSAIHTGNVESTA